MHRVCIYGGEKLKNMETPNTNNLQNNYN